MRVRKFAILPVISSLVWFGTILALLIIWLAQGHPRYKPHNPKIAYISDVGAEQKALFIAGGTVSMVFWVATLIADRMLRHRDRTPGFMRRRESIFSILAIIFGTIAALALILLTIFDAYNHDNAHWAFTAIFVIAVAINAIFFSLEINSLHHTHNREVRNLKRSRNAKAILAFFGVVFAIIMAAVGGSCDNTCTIPNTPTIYCPTRCDRQGSVAAVFEWLIAFIFAIYLATFIFDLTVDEEIAEEQVEAGNQKPLPMGNITNNNATGMSAQ